MDILICSGASKKLPIPCKLISAPSLAIHCGTVEDPNRIAVVESARGITARSSLKEPIASPSDAS